MARYPEHTSSVNSFHPRRSRYSLERMLEMLSLAIVYRLVLDLLWRCSRSLQWLEENLTFGDLEDESTWAVVGDRDYPGAGGGGGRLAMGNPVIMSLSAVQQDLCGVGF